MPKNSTAKILCPNGTYGTAWLVSPGLMLTAGHCIGDRTERKPYEGTFKVIFYGHECKIAVEIHGEPNWDRDVVLLDIIDVHKIPASARCLPLARIPPGAAELVERGEVRWRAFGYPVAHPSGLVTTGRVLDLAGQVDGACAMQLHCEQGGSGELEGLSGSAVLWHGVAIGIVRYGILEDQGVFATSIGEVASVFPEVKALLDAGPWGQHLFDWILKIPRGACRFLVAHHLAVGPERDSLEHALAGLRAGHKLAICSTDFLSHCRGIRPRLFSPLLDCHRGVLVLGNDPEAALQSLAHELAVFRARALRLSAPNAWDFKFDLVSLVPLTREMQGELLRRAGLPPEQVVRCFDLPRDEAELGDYLGQFATVENTQQTPIQRLLVEVTESLPIEQSLLVDALVELQQTPKHLPEPFRPMLLAAEVFMRPLAELVTFFRALRTFGLVEFGLCLRAVLESGWVDLEVVSNLLVRATGRSPASAVFLPWSKAHTLEMAFARARLTAPPLLDFSVLGFTGENGTDVIDLARVEIIAELRDRLLTHDGLASPTVLSPTEREELMNLVEEDGPIFAKCMGSISAEDLVRLRAEFPFLTFLVREDLSIPGDDIIRLSRILPENEEKVREQEYLRICRYLKPIS